MQAELSIEEFQGLLERVRHGSDAAAEELLDHFGAYVLRTVRRHLNRRLRVRFDSEDFAQAVWGSVFENREQIGDFDAPENLIRFLIAVTTRKVLYQIRSNLKFAKRNIDREQSLQASWGNQSLRDTEAATPSQIAIANEQWQQMVKGQPSHHRRMIELRCEGATLTEIADEVGVNERTVRRVIKRLTQALEL
jgi:RNA polymerase sigma factor (sigma-70 family)